MLSQIIIFLMERKGLQWKLICPASVDRPVRKKLYVWPILRDTSTVILTFPLKEKVYIRGPQTSLVSYDWPTNTFSFYLSQGPLQEEYQEEFIKNLNYRRN